MAPGQKARARGAEELERGGAERSEEEEEEEEKEERGGGRQGVVKGGEVGWGKKKQNLEHG